jgi:hypothetical protein
MEGRWQKANLLYNETATYNFSSLVCESATSTPKRRNKFVIIKKKTSKAKDILSREGTKEAAARISLIFHKPYLGEQFFFTDNFNVQNRTGRKDMNS